MKINNIDSHIRPFKSSILFADGEVGSAERFSVPGFNLRAKEVLAMIKGYIIVPVWGFSLYKFSISAMTLVALSVIL